MTVSEQNKSRIGIGGVVDVHFVAAMPASVFASCSDGCGWVGAVVASLAFGSFGVPIKTGVKVEVDPLVMQVYEGLLAFSFFSCHFLLTYFDILSF